MHNVALEQEFIAADITMAQAQSSIANVGPHFPHLDPVLIFSIISPVKCCLHDCWTTMRH